MTGKHPIIFLNGLIPYDLYFFISNWFAALRSSCESAFLIFSLIASNSGFTTFVFRASYAYFSLESALKEVR